FFSALIMLCSSALFSSTTALAQDNASPKQLKELRHRIQRMQSQYDRDLKKRDNLSHTLQQQDKRIAEHTRKDKQIKQQKKTTKQRLNKVEQQQAAMAAAQRTQH